MPSATVLHFDVEAATLADAHAKARITAEAFFAPATGSEAVIVEADAAHIERRVGNPAGVAVFTTFTVQFRAYCILAEPF